jgi:hypothetical protein
VPSIRYYVQQTEALIMRILILGGAGLMSAGTIGSYKGKMTSPVEVENTWEETYQIAEKTRAA